jgi:OOP family OmpA-OmpF porin
MHGIYRSLKLLKNRIIMFKKIVIASALALIASASFAQSAPGVYAGVDIGTTDFDGVDDSETSAGAFVGYNFDKNFGLEANYRNLFDKNNVEANQFGLSMIATMPLSNTFSVYGRLGYNRLNIESGGFKDHESKVLYGAGVSYAFTPSISGRVEVQKPHSDLTNLSAGVVFKF